MKDYSKYIKSSYGFITKYVVDRDQIFVYTAESEKDKPHVYLATKENLKYIDERLENQYKLILQNRNFIESDYSKTVCDKIIKIGEIILCVLFVGTMFASNILNIALPLVLGIILGSSAFIGSTLFAEYKREKLKEYLDLCQDYLNNRENLSIKRENDSNVIRSLSGKTLELIEKKEKQKDVGLIDSAFDIDLMDKMELQDLRRLLINYRICREIKNEQTFVNAAEKKKLIKKKERKR